jgi:hypothetical protein
LTGKSSRILQGRTRVWSEIGREKNVPEGIDHRFRGAQFGLRISKRTFHHFAAESIKKRVDGK